MSGPSDRLRILVLGYIVRGPTGGLTWHHLQYMMGLCALGHDPYFVEDSDEYPCCYDPSQDGLGTNPTYGLAYAARCFDRVGLGERWAYHDAHLGSWHGPCAGRILDVCRTADLVLNVSGVNPLRPWCLDVPARALLDTDPVFTQLRHLEDPAARQLAEQHTAFLSFGENFERPGCAIPDDGFPWQPTRQPVVLDAWPVTPGPAQGKFTTVMLWNCYPPRVYRGQRFGLKSDSFGPYWDLPRRAGPVFELAVGSASAPREALLNHGWALRNPLEAASDPWAFQDYVRQSKAEFTVAKHGYVVSRSGWFSERSAGYLASGRPVVVQDTGFADWLPTGRGVLMFRTPDEARASVESVDRSYPDHCREARALAEEYFDARKVLPPLLEKALQPAPARPASSNIPENWVGCTGD
jgi:hypothetical protein